MWKCLFGQTSSPFLLLLLLKALTFSPDIFFVLLFLSFPCAHVQSNKGEIVRHNEHSFRADNRKIRFSVYKLNDPIIGVLGEQFSMESLWKYRFKIFGRMWTTNAHIYRMPLIGINFIPKPPIPHHISIIKNFFLLMKKKCVLLAVCWKAIKSISNGIWFLGCEYLSVIFPLKFDLIAISRRFSFIMTFPRSIKCQMKFYEIWDCLYDCVSMHSTEIASSFCFISVIRRQYFISGAKVSWKEVVNCHSTNEKIRF